MNYIHAGIAGPWQLVIVVIALLLLFGGKKIPELMKGLGQGMKEFKKATKDEDNAPDVEPGENEKLKG